LAVAPRAAAVKDAGANAAVPAQAARKRPVCRICPTVWGWKSPVRPDGGEAL